MPTLIRPTPHCRKPQLILPIPGLGEPADLGKGEEVRVVGVEVVFGGLGDC